MAINLHTIKASQHSIAIENAGGDALLIDASGHLSINDGGNSLTIDGTLTGITNDVNIADGGNSITVDAVDLDVRDITHVSDSIKVGDGTDFLAVNADGSINVLSQSGGLDSWQTSTTTVANTATEIAATPLANRLRMEIQNLGAQDVYLGEDNTVLTTTGLLLPKGSSAELMLGAVSNIFGITASSTADCRIAEYAA